MNTPSTLMLNFKTGAQLLEERTIWTNKAKGLTGKDLADVKAYLVEVEAEYQQRLAQNKAGASTLSKIGSALFDFTGGSGGQGTAGVLGVAAATAQNAGKAVADTAGNVGSAFKTVLIVVGLGAVLVGGFIIYTNTKGKK